MRKAAGLLDRFHSTTRRQVAQALRAENGRGAWTGPHRGDERVIGPFKGYYVAVYAAQRSPGNSMAFYKVCDGAPADYWSAHCLLKGSTPAGFGSAQAALEAAEALALENIGNLPSLERLRRFDPVQMFSLIGLDQWPRPVAL
jgi:hypothetical protein